MKAFLVVTLLCTAAVARADTKEERATKAFKEGKALLDAGKVSDAIEKFEAAYSIEQNPAYLFALGVAYLEVDRCKDAVERLQLYLDYLDKLPDDEDSTAKSNRAKAESQLAIAKKCAPKEREPVEQPEKPMPPPPPPPKRSIIAPVSLGLAGAALVTVGVVFTFKVSSTEKDRAAVCPSGCTWDDVKDARARELTRIGERDSKIAIASYVAGSLAIAGGIAIYVANKPKYRETAITIAPQKGGGVVIGQFRF